MFEVSVKINAPLEKVWSIISDFDSETRFWKGTRSTKIIQQEGNTIIRESRLAFMNSLSKERVTMNPKSSVKIEYIEGPILGEKVIELQGNSETIVRVKWHVRMKGIAGLLNFYTAGHISCGIGIRLCLLRASGGTRTRDLRLTKASLRPG